MKKIKLVIWDLDETFWNGTLSEEGINPIKQNIELIKKLTNRGIINSICSKNDFSKAKEKLLELGIWDFFIFPSISWSPKGLQVKDIIEKCQLRDENVLFLDDNHSNLEEVKFYCKNIYVEYPDFIPNILEHLAFKGKDDNDQSRLKQYKILEKKNSEISNYSSNIEFLKSSNIILEYIEDVENYTDRIFELIERTNQLNFTKKRINKEEITQLLSSQEVENCLIKVRDNFGDYGIVGFYSYSKRKHFLEHFVFSCRILNIGIEQYLYDTLGYPSLNIVPDIAVTLENNNRPDWIQVKNSEDYVKEIKQTDKKRIFFKGGCDLSQMLFYLNYYDFKIIEETNYVSKENIPIHNDHSQIIINGLSINEEDKDRLSKTLPFIDAKTYKSELFDFNFDFLVFSPLMDYTQVLYEEKRTGIRVPYGGYNNIIETENNQIKELFLNYNFDKFKKEFTYIGPISVDEFIRNLKTLRDKVPKRTPMIFMNGSEVDVEFETEIGALKRHKTMNIALEKFIDEAENCYLLDVRKIVFDRTHVNDNIRHYSRIVYKNLADELLNILNLNIEKDKINYNKFFKSYLLRSKLIQILKKNNLIRKIYLKLIDLNA